MALAKTGVVVAVTSACVRACASVRRVPNSPSPYVRTERVCLRSDWLHFAVDLARTLLCEVSCHVNGDCATCVLCAFSPPLPPPQTATHACLSYTCARVALRTRCRRCGGTAYQHHPKVMFYVLDKRVAAHTRRIRVDVHIFDRLLHMAELSLPLCLCVCVCTIT